MYELQRLEVNESTTFDGALFGLGTVVPETDTSPLQLLGRLAPPCFAIAPGERLTLPLTAEAIAMASA